MSLLIDEVKELVRLSKYPALHQGVRQDFANDIAARAPLLLSELENYKKACEFLLEFAADEQLEHYQKILDGEVI